MVSSGTPWRMTNGWMLLQRRHASVSTGNTAGARSCDPSEASHASAASLIGRVETPVFSILKRPGVTVPSVVMPLNGCASNASPSSR
jgi:hypothetical protein